MEKIFGSINKNIKILKNNIDLNSNKFINCMKG